MKALIENIDFCRVCLGPNLNEIHSFGIVPLADRLISDRNEHVASAPLTLLTCEKCKHIQIKENVNPDSLFKYDYPYLSSNIPEVVQHFFKVSQNIIYDFKVQNDSFIIEIAGNDGVFLKNFLKIGCRTLNVEPSLAPADISKLNNINTISSFFSQKVAEEIGNQFGRPLLVFAANVLAHVPNPNDFVAGLAILASEQTTIIIEVPHALPMIEQNLFDVIFHQHFSYFHLHALNQLFNHHQLFINKTEKVNTQGGSLRLYISKNNLRIDHSVDEILNEEIQSGILTENGLFAFINSITSIKTEVQNFLKSSSLNNKKVVGYGAPGKAATLLNYFEIKYPQLEYLVDISPTKQNRIFPFTNLYVYPVERLLEDIPDFIIILSWNYADSIIEKLKSFKELNHVRFILMHPIFRFLN